jgi:protein disulfide-isomerase
MKNLKRWAIWIGVFCAIGAQCSAAEWLTDYDVALGKARAEHKTILLDFTGSDWCGWCKKLKSEVFDQPEFDAFANANLVLVEVDFPRHWVLSRAQQDANNSLAQKYGIRGYPTIILLNASGNKIAETGYRDGGPKPYIAHLEKITAMKHSSSTPDAAPPRPAPEFVPIPAAKPIQYGELALKAISGSAGRRMALINNETFLVGETAKVKVKESKVEVTCKEIRADSVLLTVDGKIIELKLPHQ